MTSAPPASAADIERAEADARFEAFVHSVVHDLRSPLVTMESMAGLLRESAMDRLRPDESGYLDHIENGARAMRDLLTDLSEYTLIKTRISASETIETGELVAKLLREMAVEVASSGAEFLVASDLPAVRGDVSAIEQLFRQLLENSLKFRRRDVAPRIELSAARGASGIEFAFRDNGIGIPAQSLEKVFGVFTRLHPKSRYPGTGIGLAIVKRVIEGHGGAVAIESGEGAGTTVRFTLPG